MIQVAAPDKVGVHLLTVRLCGTELALTRRADRLRTDGSGLPTCVRSLLCRAVRRGRSVIGRGRERAGRAGDALQPVAVVLPPRPVARRHVVVAVEQTHGSVDQLPDDVGVPGMPV